VRKRDLLFGIAGLVVGAAVVAVLAIAICGSDEGEDEIPDRGRAFAPVPEPEAGELAGLFRPWLRFDSDEPWRPISIDSLLSERSPGGRPAHEFCSRSGPSVECNPIDGKAGFEAALGKASVQGERTYIDIAGRRVKEYRAPGPDLPCRKGPLRDCGEGPGSAIYYRVTSSNGRFYVDYWWFMRFNHFGPTSGACAFRTKICGEHEGDWEGVTLVTAPGDDDSLDYAVYAAHDGTFRYPAQQLKLHRGRRPEVFVANGSHASYPRACSKLVCSQPIAIGGKIDLPETSTDGRRPWERNGEDCAPGAPGSCLLPFPRADTVSSGWVNWPGLWGETCGDRCRSKGPQAPASPGLQTRFLYPWCSIQDGAPTCDIVAPSCSDWLGPLVAVLACNPAAVANGLRSPEELPAGGLALTVTAPDGSTREVSATTTGVVQGLGPPLPPGSQVALSGAGPNTEIIVRARQERQLLEARFEPGAADSSPATAEIRVGVRAGRLVVLATTAEGVRIAPVEMRRVLLPNVG
jgi:hypothetical protein